jgi:Leucine-rich repeat (LRR) protein
MKKIILIIFFTSFSPFYLTGQIDTTFESGSISIGIDFDNFIKIDRELKNIVKCGDAKKIINNMEISGDFDFIPNSIFEFTEVTFLLINSSKKIKIGNAINKMKALTTIRITSEVTFMSKGIVLPNLSNVYFGMYTAKKIPQLIFECSKLEYLTLEGGSYKTVPREIANLKELKLLNLSANKLNKLPDEIGQLSNLRVLSLDGNLLSALPNTICNLKKLEELYILNNPNLNVDNEIKQCLTFMPNLNIVY